VPEAYSAFEDYRLDAQQFSGAAMACLRRMLAGDAVTQADSGMSPGEWREFRAALDGSA
jgi:thymidylate synthase (FAD)